MQNAGFCISQKSNMLGDITRNLTLRRLRPKPYPLLFCSLLCLFSSFPSPHLLSHCFILHRPSFYCQALPFSSVGGAVESFVVICSRLKAYGEDWWCDWLIDRHVTSCSRRTKHCAVAWSCRRSNCQRCAATSASFDSTRSRSFSTRWTRFTCSVTPRSDRRQQTDGRTTHVCIGQPRQDRRWPNIRSQI